MEGTITKRERNSCLITADEGGEEFYASLNRARNPEEFQEGSRVFFEPGNLEPPPGKPRGAIRLRLLQAGGRSEYVPRPRPKPEDLQVRISFAFAEGALLITVQTNRVGATVRLSSMTEEESVQTDADGKAEFILDITAETKNALVGVVVDGKTFTKAWFRNPPQSETETTKQRIEKSSPTHLKVKANQVGGTMIIQVTATKGPKPEAPVTPMKFAVRSESGASRFRICEAGSTNWKSGSEVELECPGQQSYQFQWTTRIAGENIYLRAEGNPQEFGPYYVTGHCLAPAESGHLASPATATIH